jgi:hypothetical protein
VANVQDLNKRSRHSRTILTKLWGRVSNRESAKNSVEISITYCWQDSVEASTRNFKMHKARSETLHDYILCIFNLEEAPYLEKSLQYVDYDNTNYPSCAQMLHSSNVKVLRNCSGTQGDRPHRGGGLFCKE